MDKQEEALAAAMKQRWDKFNTLWGEYSDKLKAISGYKSVEVPFDFEDTRYIIGYGKYGGKTKSIVIGHADSDDARDPGEMPFLLRMEAVRHLGELYEAMMVSAKEQIAELDATCEEFREVLGL